MTVSYWSGMAGLWRFVGPPLRPAPDDCSIVHSTVLSWCAAHEKAPRVLILGVTPELYALDWPAGTQLRALDCSQEMISSVWPGAPADAILGGWTAMPLDADSFDIVVCDGGLGLLSYPDEQNQLLCEVRRVLAPGGRFIVRLFTPKGRTGSMDEVLVDLAEKRIASIDVFKLRLWGALHGDKVQGVRLRDVAEQVLSIAGDLDEFAATHGWTSGHLRSLLLYRESMKTYYLTEVSELVRMASETPGGFELNAITEPGYTLGSCCPIVTLTRV